MALKVVGSNPIIHPIKKDTLLGVFFYGDNGIRKPDPGIVDVHAKGVSKLRSARLLQQELGKKILICVGDAENDLTMLEGADYAFCPSDGVIAQRFPNVCPCGDGAIADVIYKEIPKIIKKQS